MKNSQNEENHHKLSIENIKQLNNDNYDLKIKN